MSINGRENFDKLRREATRNKREQKEAEKLEKEAFTQMISDVYAGKYDGASEDVRKGVATKILGYVRGLTQRRKKDVLGLRQKADEIVVTDAEMQEHAAGLNVQSLKAGGIEFVPPKETAERIQVKPQKKKGESAPNVLDSDEELDAAE